MDEIRTRGGLREESPIINGPHGEWDLRWSEPGTHTVVYEVWHHGQLPQYYSFEQTVVEPTTFAAQQLAEQAPTLDAEMYLLSLTMMLEQAEQSEETDPDQLKQLTAALTNAEALLADGGTPLSAVLVLEETSETLPLNLFVQETDEGYALIDLTNPHPNATRTYRGDTLEAAWEDFVQNNTLPAGRLAATPPEGAVNTSEELWNIHSNGQSTLEEWSNGLGWLSTLAAVAGAAMVLTPGLQVPGGVVLGTVGAGAGIGAVSVGLSMADRAKYGNLTWNTQTQLEVADLVSSAFIGAHLLRSGTKMSIKTLGKYGVKLEIMEASTDATSTFLLSKEYYEQIESISEDPYLSEDEKDEYIREIVQQALAMGGLRVIGASINRLEALPAVTHQQNRRINRAISEAGIDPELAEAIRKSENLQKIVRVRRYDLTELQNEWRQWKSMHGSVPNQSFEVWMTNYSLYKVSADDTIKFYEELKKRDFYNKTSLRRDTFINYPGFMAHTLKDDTLLKEFLYDSNNLTGDISDDLLLDSMVSIVDAAYLAGLDVHASQRLFLDANGFGGHHVSQLRDLASDGVLTRLLKSGFDDETINTLLDTYDKATLEAIDSMISHGLHAHRALEAIRIADATGHPGLRDELVALVNSGNLGYQQNLANFMGQVRDELAIGAFGKLWQLEEAVERSKRGHTVTVETKQGDLIDFTAQLGNCGNSRRLSNGQNEGTL